MGRKKTKPARKHRPVVQFSQRAADYAHMLAAPFSYPAAHPPTEMAMPSFLLTTTVNGYVYTGAGWGGFIMVDLAAMVTNDVAGVYYTTSAYPTSQAAATFQNSGTGISSAFSNSPYSASDFGENQMFRVLVGGLQLQYDGAKINEGGNIVKICHPSMGDLDGLGVSALLAIPGVKHERITDRIQTVTSCPCMPDEENFTKVTSGRTCMGAIVGSAAANQALSFKAIVVAEVVGTKVRGQTRVASDTRAADAIVAAMSRRFTPGVVGEGHNPVSVMNDAAQELSSGTQVLQEVGELGGAAYASSKLLPAAAGVGRAALRGLGRLAGAARSTFAVAEEAVPLLAEAEPILPFVAAALRR